MEIKKTVGLEIYKHKILAIIEEVLPGCVVYLFGSRARQSNSEGADIDIALEMTEEDTETLLAMMDDRNMTSHTYLEEVAEKMSSQVARYHQLMHHYAQNLTRKSI